MFILVNFGNDPSQGVWNMKRFNFPTIADAVEVGERTTIKENGGEGFVILHSYFDSDKGYDRMEVVYSENADGVDIQVFPYICVKALTMV